MKRDVTLTAQEWSAICAMREAQKRFHRSRRDDAIHQVALIDSRSLEKRVDAIIAHRNEESETPALPLE